MENIHQIALKIFSKEPEPKNSIQLEIVNHKEPAIIYEILAILFAECLEIKLPNILKYNKNIDKFITTIKQYFNSFGIDFDLELLDKNNYNTRDFFNVLLFQVNKKYHNFFLRSEYKYFDFFIPYEPSVHTTINLSELKLCIKVKEEYYRIGFKFL